MLLIDSQELRTILNNNPNLPLLVFAGEEANSGDYNYWMSCSELSVEVGECLVTDEYEHIFTDRRDFEDYLLDNIDYALHTDDERLIQIVQATLEIYEPLWQKCIILHIDN